VIQIIDSQFPWAKEEVPTSAQDLMLHPAILASLGGVMSVVDQIPTELLATAGSEDYARLQFAAGELREMIATTQAYRAPAGTQGGYLSLRPNERYGGYNVLSFIRQLLAKCRDQAPLENSSRILFLHPPETRQSLLSDIASVERGLSNGDFKAATVVGGSVMEALLLWALKQRPSELAKLTSKPSGEPEDWKVKHLISVASQLRLIEESSTAAVCRLAKDCRDLIHPGAVLKNPFPCDQGTALTSLAAVYSVIRDLEKHFG
jgi:hypothetical protein